MGVRHKSAPRLVVHVLAQAGLGAGLMLVGWRLIALLVPGLALALIGFVVAASGVPLAQYLLPTGPALPLTFRLLGLLAVLGILSALAPGGDRLTHTE